MKVIIDDVQLEEKDGLWRISVREVLEPGDELRVGYRMVDGKREEFQEEVGHEREVIIIRPRETLAWRASEYGIDKDDLNTLIDITILEGYISREWWHE